MDLKKLWELQCLYLSRQEIKALLSTDKGVKLKQEKNAILQKDDVLQRQEADLKNYSRQLKQKEREYEAMSRKKKTAEDHLYSGEVTNPKELTNMQEQVHQMQQEMDCCAEEAVLISDQLEQIQKQLQESLETLNKEKKVYRKKVEDYLRQKQELEDKLMAVEQGIELLQKTIAPEIMELYNLNTKRLGYAVLSMVEHNTCSACHLGIPALLLKEVKLGQSMVKCENCGRILYGG